jgi:PUA domain protein
VSLVIVNNEPLFFQERDGPYMPTLRLLHKCTINLKFLNFGLNSSSVPTILPTVQIDKGGIKYIFGGAHVMCPGMTSPGGRLPEEDLPIDTVVVRVHIVLYLEIIYRR